MPKRYTNFSQIPPISESSLPKTYNRSGFHLDRLSHSKDRAYISIASPLQSQPEPSIGSPSTAVTFSTVPSVSTQNINVTSPRFCMSAGYTGFT